jgi:hypothetical protein
MAGDLEIGMGTRPDTDGAGLASIGAMLATGAAATTHDVPVAMGPADSA